MNMQRKRVNSYETSYTHEHSTIWLLQELQSIIGSYYYQRGESIFRVTKGVPQGHPLSSNLAFAYLNSFENEYWRKEKIDSRIVYSRYEDDYIVLTTEKHIFHEMMRPLITGRNRYFLKINKEKLMASEKGEDITWCGVTINLRKIEFSHRRLCKDGIKRRLLIKF
uniref:Telomerase reverse transcriptase n=1 Tax=Caenorhabditis tropicalis TaxID=1561998 RepID=A0A1I7UY84_9PELO